MAEVSEVIQPYHGVEFEIFLKEIGNANLPNWTILAEALGVSDKTIRTWRKHPLAQQAVSSAIEASLKKMEEVGANDWKMHREKLKMLGVKDKQTIEHEAGETISDILDSVGTDYGKFANKARSETSGQVVENDPPVQNQE